MEFWTRTQNKKGLCRLKDIYIREENSTFVLENKHYLLGTYKTEERALDILNEINFGIMYFGLSYSELKALAKSENIKMQGNFVFNANTNVAVYNMPEE